MLQSWKIRNSSFLLLHPIILLLHFFYGHVLLVYILTQASPNLPLHFSSTSLTILREPSVHTYLTTRLSLYGCTFIFSPHIFSLFSYILFLMVNLSFVDQAHYITFYFSKFFCVFILPSLTWDLPLKLSLSTLLPFHFPLLFKVQNIQRKIYYHYNDYYDRYYYYIQCKWFLKWTTR